MGQFSTGGVGQFYSGANKKDAPNRSLSHQSRSENVMLPRPGNSRADPDDMIITYSLSRVAR